MYSPRHDSLQHSASRAVSGRHAQPGLPRRIARAARRGAARAVSFPLWPGYVLYKHLEPTWK